MVWRRAWCVAYGTERRRWARETNDAKGEHGTMEWWTRWRGERARWAWPLLLSFVQYFFPLVKWHKKWLWSLTRSLMVGPIEPQSIAARALTLLSLSLFASNSCPQRTSFRTRVYICINTNKMTMTNHLWIPIIIRPCPISPSKWHLRVQQSHVVLRQI